MIVIDTNVLSEMMKAMPAVKVVTWMNSWPVSQLFTTTITMAEVLYGLQLTPVGKRRIALQQASETMFEIKFAGRILGFDEDAARVFADIFASRRKLGRPIGVMDAPNRRHRPIPGRRCCDPRYQRLSRPRLATGRSLGLIPSTARALF